MKVYRDNGKESVCVYRGSKKQCEKYVTDVLKNNEYKYHTLIDINMNLFFEVYEGKYGPKSFCFFFKKY